MIPEELLYKLCCPESRQPLQVASAELVSKLNEEIATGRLVNRAGRTVREKISAGLVRSDGQFLYPVRHDIPVMLVEEAIPLDPAC